MGQSVPHCSETLEETALTANGKRFGVPLSAMRSRKQHSKTDAPSRELKVQGHEGHASDQGEDPWHEGKRGDHLGGAVSKQAEDPTETNRFEGQGRSFSEPGGNS